MTIQLYDYQQDGYDAIHQEWLTHDNVLAVFPTGAGKTVIFSKVILDHNGPCCAIAHRQELVGQISLALAHNGVRHRIIAPESVIRNIIKLHLIKFGKAFHNDQSPVGVAGVDTLIRRKVELASWLNSVTLWVTDEGHHLLKGNKWGKAARMFPNAKGLGVTATPTRTDGQGLGRHHDGLYDVMVEGPTMRELINRGFLTEYRVIAPPSDLDLSHARISKSTGEFNEVDVKDAVAHSSLIAGDGKSRIIGDVVRIYIERFKGMLSVVFVPSVADAEKLEAQFLEQGIPAKSLNGNTVDLVRARTMQKFVKRELLVLINVALFDEGTDIPALEVVQDAYPTQSYGRYVQRFGRVLRLMEGKKYGWYCDHAGNVARHGLPDRPRKWSLDRRDKKSSGPSDAIPMRTCPNKECFAIYERHLNECPYCGLVPPPPKERSGPEFVDGDLFELSPETLAAMRGEVDRVDMDVDQAGAEYRASLLAKHCPTIGVISNTKKFMAKHSANQQGQEILRESFAIWAGYRRAEGLSDSEIYKMFYFQQGCVDYLTAMTYSSGDAMVIANNLMERV